MLYLVTYDLNKVKDYDRLYKALQSFPGWNRDPNLDSVWFISTSLSAQQVSDHVRGAMDGDDNLFVTKLRSGEYAGWMSKDLWPWISARL